MPDGEDCYEAAAKLVMEFGDRATLVHGRPTLTREPFATFGHAWVEVVGPMTIDYVHDVSNGADVFVPAHLYYDLGRIDPDECRRYSHEETLVMICKHEHWGPWDDGQKGEP